MNSFGIHGVEGFPVTVEADLGDGLPAFILVGYLSGEVREAQERVRTALKNSGLRLPPRKLTINLSPADVRKEGTAYDLAIAAAVLCSLGEAKPEIAEMLEQWAFIGELGLDGSVKPVPGILSRVYEASRQGIRRIFLPWKNLAEGRNVPEIEVIGLHHLSELFSYLKNSEQKPEVSIQEFLKEESEGVPGECVEESVDFEEVLGLPVVRRACEAAAAGKHNLLFIGPAGTGKTMVARRLPTILPPMTLEESMEVSKIYSICGMLPKGQALIRKRPFRSPHHTITAQALTGGGRAPGPGEISLASRGILFLDELAEFPPWILDQLRQPMEEEKITVSRLRGTVTFPAAPLVVAAMNPCKCGLYPDPRCRCTEPQIRKYLGRISGPFLDRMDLGVEVPRQSFSGATGQKTGESSAVMRERVLRARKRQEERFGGNSSNHPEKAGLPFWNSQMDRKQIRQFCRMKENDEKFFEQVCERMGFSIRGRDKIRKVARTLADLDGAEQISREHLSEAIAFRSFEYRYWGMGK